MLIFIFLEYKKLGQNYCMRAFQVEKLSFFIHRILDFKSCLPFLIFHVLIISIGIEKHFFFKLGNKIKII